MEKLLSKALIAITGFVVVYLIFSTVVRNSYFNSPAGQAEAQAQLAQLDHQGEGFWQQIRASDPNGALFLHYRITDAEVGGVIWVTVTNQWFYLPAGEQDQARDMLSRLWGRYQGLSTGKGPVILVDLADRQL